MKVVIISHFSNQEVREYLPLDYNRRLYYFVNRLFGRKLDRNSKGAAYSDISPWVALIINELKSRKDIELVVISAQTGLKGIVSSFVSNSIKYYFFNTDFSLFLKRIIPSPKLWRFLEPNAKVVSRIIKKEKPDIINLIGSDGAYFSTTVLPIKDIPILVSLQTVYTNPDRQKHSDVDKYNWHVEEEIIKKNNYYASIVDRYYHLIKPKNSKAIFLKFEFPNSDPRDIPNEVNVETQFDFVTFAQNCTNNKGTFDALSAFAIVHKKHPETNFNVCGVRSAEAEQIMGKIVEDNNLQDCVTFTDFFEKQEGLFKHLKKSRIAVLPVKLDYISGTIRQAMALGLPIATNATIGTPTLNEEKECVLLSRIDNIQQLADNMLRLYEDKEYADMLRKNALDNISKLKTNKQKADELVDDLYAVYDNYRNGTPIPEKLIFIGN